MNQDNIGKFILELRNEKGWTHAFVESNLFHYVNNLFLYRSRILIRRFILFDKADIIHGNDLARES